MSGIVLTRGSWAVIVLATIVFGTSGSTTFVQKCCPQMEALNETLECTPSGHKWFYSNFTYGLGNCSYGEVVAAVEGAVVSCIDNLWEKDSIVAVKCAGQPYSFVVPPVNYVRKCCPIERPYDSVLQSCWGDRESVNWSPKEFLNVVMSGFSGVVDIREGAPICAQDYVLADYLVPFNDVWREESESIVFKAHGFEETRLNPDDVCLDLTERRDVLVVRACQPAEIICRPLGSRTCVRKCCPDGHSMLGPTCQAMPNRTFGPLTFFRETPDGIVPNEGLTPAFYHGDPCPIGKYILIPESNPLDAFYLTVDGKLLSPSGPHELFCFENVYAPEYLFDGDYFFACFGTNDENTNPIKLIFNASCMIVSCIFFCLILTVYTCLPNLRNLHGRTLMCHVACLLIAYASLSAITFASVFGEIDSLSCVILGFVVEFSFLAAFGWLNIISFDIWWTFGSMRPTMGRKSREKRRFIAYSVYAWSFAAIITSMTIAADFTYALPEYLMPSLGTDETCWFSRNSKGHLLFFIGPVSFLLASNVVFFALTARHCSKVKNELHRINHSALAKKTFRADKRKLIMNCKLFVVMGVSWTLEVISNNQYMPEEVWYLSDLANALQGVLIFCIFILKKKVMKAFSRRVKEVVCHIEPKQHRPSTSTLFTVMNNGGGSSANCHEMRTLPPLPYPLKKSTSDSRLAVGRPPLKTQRSHARLFGSSTVMSSSSPNRLTVGQDHRSGQG